MAKRRMISQELIIDEDFNSLSIEAQLLFFRMLAVSDDCGIVPAAEYTLTHLTNPPEKIKKNLESYVNEITSKSLGNIVKYEGKKYFLFKRKSFDRFQSYIINKRVSSEYLKISAKEFDEIDWTNSETKGISNSSIPVEVRRYFANMFGCAIDKTSDSKTATCVNCKKEGRISNNGFGYITLTGLNFDHIVPHRFGGSNKIENFQILCPKCNQEKKYADIDKFKALLVEELNRESIDDQLNVNCGAIAIESRKIKDTRLKTKEYTEKFEKFWNLYPRKEGKGKASAIFEKIKPDDDLLATILISVEAHKQSEQWRKDGGQFIPHPSTYLSQERWNDQINRGSGGKEPGNLGTSGYDPTKSKYAGKIINAGN